MSPDNFFEQEPPYHLESEQSIIGGLLLDNQAFDRISDKVSEADFFTRDNRLLFRACADILGKNQPLDLVTLSQHLDDRKQLDDVGGIAFLHSLVQNTPTSAHIDRYADIVRDKSLLRTMAQISDEIRKRVVKPDGATAKELLDFAQGKFMAIGENVAKGNSSMQSMQVVLPLVADKIDEMFMREGDDDVVGLSTGLTDLDKLTTGLQPDDLFVLAGRPSMGKTALALNIARHVALDGKNVAIFSLEMSNDKLVYRFLSDLSGIHSQRLRTGRLYEGDWAGLTTAMGKLNDVGIHMDDDASLTVGDIKARARRLFRSLPDGLHLIVIDYLQLIVTPGGSANRANDVAEVTRELKRLAKELQVPVLVLSQLNRSVESRPDKRPVMSDLRESGGIEQDADLIAFVYRDEYYNHDSEYKGTAEIIIAKQRNGPVDTVRTNFVSHLTRFEDYVYMKPEDGSERYE